VYLDQRLVPMHANKLLLSIHGLKSSGTSFRNHLTNCMWHLGWVSCIADQDLWMKAKVWLSDGHSIREAENLFTSKWNCLDFIWSIINHIYPFLSHFDLMKSQKFEIEPVIWKGSWTQNQVQMTQYSIFYCIIDQNGLKKSKVT
jgi:hypothetical protein